jgi:hypothetical protein
MLRVTGQSCVATKDVIGTRYHERLRDALLTMEPSVKPGEGAAMVRIEALRRLGPRNPGYRR